MGDRADRPARHQEAGADGRRIVSGSLGTLIVTGASRGIGAAVALAAGHAGYDVAVNYAGDELSAAKVVHAIEGAGRRAVAIRADVAHELDVKRLFAEAAERLGVVSALVNNAGITGGFARVDEVTLATIERVFAVNVTGTMLCSREAVRRMSTKHGGSGGAIVNMSSRAATLGGAGEWVHYAATKGAIDTFTIGLAREVADEDIRVNAVAPGLIDTDLHAAAGEPGRIDRMAPGVPMKRPGSAEEIAAGVLWLLSPEASYVTGTIVPIAGGR
jgi:NAD(P)-dependent dehydrogenase (short-subunit alcohol dehydrogenase family)